MTAKAALLAWLLLAAPAAAETIAITNGTLAIGDGGAPIERGTVIVRDGRIVAAGATLTAPAGARVIDAAGRWITPGIVAGFSRIGLVEVDSVSQASDTSATTSPYSAAIDVVPAINPRAAAVAVSRADGLTRAVVAPETGRSIFAGQGAVIDLGADMDAITRPRAFQLVELGETGSERAGGSRAAAHVQLRAALDDARRYAADPARFGGDQRDSLSNRPDAAALLPVADGRIPLAVHVERASDILAALDLRRGFPKLRLVLIGASEGWMVARQIAAANVPVVASALSDLPASFETLAATQSNIARMAAAGVRIAIGMDQDDESRQARLVRQYAGNLVALTKVPGAAGLSWGAALASITSGPAAAFGMEGEIGSLRAGRRADVVLWDGDPLEPASAPSLVLIDGIEQPLTTRATRLRDRYRVPGEGSLPKAYER